MSMCYGSVCVTKILAWHVGQAVPCRRVVEVLHLRLLPTRSSALWAICSEDTSLRVLGKYVARCCKAGTRRRDIAHNPYGLSSHCPVSSLIIDRVLFGVYRIYTLVLHMAHAVWCWLDDLDWRQLAFPRRRVWKLNIPTCNLPMSPTFSVLFYIERMSKDTW